MDNRLIREIYSTLPNTEKYILKDLLNDILDIPLLISKNKWIRYTLLPLLYKHSLHSLRSLVGNKKGIRKGKLKSWSVHVLPLIS